MGNSSTKTHVLLFEERPVVFDLICVPPTDLSIPMPGHQEQPTIISSSGLTAFQVSRLQLLVIRVVAGIFYLRSRSSCMRKSQAGGSHPPMQPATAKCTPAAAEPLLSCHTARVVVRRTAPCSTFLANNPSTPVSMLSSPCEQNNAAAL